MMSRIELHLSFFEVDTLLQLARLVRIERIVFIKIFRPRSSHSFLQKKSVCVGCFFQPQKLIVFGHFVEQHTRKNAFFILFCFCLCTNKENALLYESGNFDKEMRNRRDHLPLFLPWAVRSRRQNPIHHYADFDKDIAKKIGK
jgi:hypothetical protein